MNSGEERDEPIWLERQQLRAWISLVAMVSVLPTTIESQLQREADLTFFEYTVLAMLSESDDHTLPMSELAAVANGSLSRLSHVAKRLESRNYLQRRPLPTDGRVTVATLTDAGLGKLQRTAPGHACHVRRQVIDALSAQDLRALERICMKVLRSVDPCAADAVTAHLPPAE